MRRGLRAEWGKTWSVRAPWACLVMSGFLAVVTAVSLANDLVLSAATGERAPGLLSPVSAALGPALQVSQLALAAFALQLVTAEHATGAWRSTLLAQPRRYLVVLSKALVASACGAAAGTVEGGSCAVMVVAVLGEHATPGGPSLLNLAWRAGALFALVAILAVGSAALLRSAIGTLSAVAALLVGTLVLPERVGRWTPGPASAALLGDGSSPPVVGCAILAAWAGVALMVGTLAVERRDA